MPNQLGFINEIGNKLNPEMNRDKRSYNTQSLTLSIYTQILLIPEA